MKLINRFIAVILVLSVLPITVFAEDEDKSFKATDEINMSNVSEYENLTVSEAGIKGVNNEAWAVIKNVDFGDGLYSQIEFKVATPSEYAGRTISVYLDNMNSEAICMYEVESTGSYDSFKTQSSYLNYDKINGVHDVYLSFPKRATCNLESIKFLELKIGNDSELPDKIVGSTVEDYYLMLTSLGIIEPNDDADPEDKVRTKDFLGIILGVMNISDENQILEYASYHELDYQGFISVNEALEITVNVLGYDHYHKDKEEIDYNSIANERKLTDEIVGDYTDAMSYSNMLKILFKAIEVPLVCADLSTAFNYYVTDINDEVTLLSYYMNIFSEKGIVNGNACTQLTSVGNLYEDEIMIDGYLYRAGDSGADNLLGYNIKFYYFRDEIADQNIVLYCKPFKTKTIEVESRNVLTYDTNILQYEIENGKNKTLRLANGFNVIYNGLVKTKYDSNLFTSLNGNIKAIDNNNDDFYDIVVIKDSYDAIVERVSEETIYFKHGIQKIDLSDDNNAEFIIFNTYGQRITKEDILKCDEWNIMTIEYAQSEGSERYTIYFSRKSLTGKLSMYRSDEKIMKIADEQFKVSEYMLDNFNNNNIVLNDVKAIINANNEVVYLIYRSYEAQYGYVTKHKYIECDEDGNESIILKLFQQDGQIVQYKCFEKVRIDGQRYNSLYAAHTYLDTNICLNNLIIFKLNSQGLINEIDLPYENISTPKGLADRETKESFNQKYKGDELQYKSASGIFGGKVALGSNPVLFFIPVDSNYNLLTDEEKYFYIGKQTNLKDDSNYGLLAYGLSDSELATDIAVIRYKPYQPSIRNQDAGSVFCSVNEVYIEEEEEVYTEITYFNDGVEKKAIVSNEIKDTVLTMTRGDVFLFAVDNDGKIVSIKQLYDYNTKSIIGGSTAFNAVNRYQFGKVEEVQDKFMKMSGVEEIFNIGSANVYICDSNEIKVAHPNDIKDIQHTIISDSVFLQLSFADVKLVVVYR